MAEREKFVAIGLLTAPEFARWGDKLRHVYPVTGNPEFDDLLKAIDKADQECCTPSAVSKQPPERR